MQKSAQTQEDKMSLDFTGKVAIITGAGGGLGRSHALEFARRGAKVVVNDLGGTLDGSGGSSDAANKVVEEIKAAGGDAIANGSSVTDDAGVANMVQQAMDAFGRIDILVNNAGVLRDKSFTKMEIGDFEFVVGVHLMGSVKPTKAVWPIMKEQGYGRIMVTSSSSGLYGNFGQSNYGAAKLGVVGFINTLKLEGQKDNIHANALAPVAWTRMTADLMPPEAEQMLTPESVTPAVIYMCSEDAPTGRIICAGAGSFATAYIVETHGKYLGQNPTAEDVAAHWEEISKMDERTRVPVMGGEQTRHFFELSSGK
jgi:NAD(P)-dependent dehydrogenase (short-subunit alcohol dehydrogenase family)